MMRSSAILMMVLMLAASVAVSSAMITTVPVTEAVPVTLPAPGSEQGYFSINSVPSGGMYTSIVRSGEKPLLS